MRHEPEHKRKERAAILEGAHRRSREIQARALQTLDKLAQEKDPEALFVATLLQISFHQGDTPPSEATHGSTPAKLELLAYHLFPKFKSGQSSEIAPSDTASCIKALEGLFSSEWLISNLGNPNEELSIIGEVRRNAEVVRGSAYPEQTISRIVEVQGAFEAKFSQMLGIGPKRAQEFVWAIAQAQERYAHEIFQNASTRSDALTALWEEAKAKPKSQRSPEEMKLLQSHRRAADAKSFFITQEMNNLALTMLPVGPEDLHGFDVNPSPEEWAAFSRMVGLTSESRSQMSSSTDVRRKSLFVLSNGRVLLSEISNLLDNLWEEFEGAAKGDPQLWPRYLDRRTAWLEGKVFEILSQIFPPGNAYRNLSYPDPGQPDKRTAELDFAVLWGPFLVLIEAKGGQFRLEGQLNDPGRLRTDLKKNVEDAFGQAQRAVKYIEMTPFPVFSEINSTRTLRVPKEQIRRTYLLSVSLHNLGVVSTRLATLREIGLLREGEYPFAISVADLEMIGMFCEGPEIFLHYVERRLVVQKHQADVRGDEL